MDIKHIFEDPRIVMLEKEITRRNEHYRYSDEEKQVMMYLLEERRNVLWHLNVYNDETKRLLVEFNDALRKACAELYCRTIIVYQECMHREDCLKTSRLRERYFLVTNILHFTPFRQKQQSWCGMSSHVEASVRSMMMVAPGRSVSAENIRQSIADMRP